MGGILGRKIRVIKEDGASDWPTFAENQKLLVNDHGCGLRLLDQRLAQGRAADLREGKRPCCTTPPSTKAWSRART